MRADLAAMWSPSNKAGNPRRNLAKTSFLHCDEEFSCSDDGDSVDMKENMKSMKVEETCCFFSFFNFLAESCLFHVIQASWCGNTCHLCYSEHVFAIICQ